MKLLTQALLKKLPPLYANEPIVATDDNPEPDNSQRGLNAPALVKFFTPDSNWTWYASEFDGQDIFFGLVVGFEVELGYFSLSEIESIRGPLGLKVERDMYFSPTSLADLLEQHR